MVPGRPPERIHTGQILIDRSRPGRRAYPHALAANLGGPCHPQRPTIAAPEPQLLAFGLCRPAGHHNFEPRHVRKEALGRLRVVVAAVADRAVGRAHRQAAALKLAAAAEEGGGKGGAAGARGAGQQAGRQPGISAAGRAADLRRPPCHMPVGRVGGGGSVGVYGSGYGVPAVPVLGCLVDQLVEGREDVVGKLDLRGDEWVREGGWERVGG